MKKIYFLLLIFLGSLQSILGQYYYEGPNKINYTLRQDKLYFRIKQPDKNSKTNLVVKHLCDSLISFRLSNGILELTDFNQKGLLMSKVNSEDLIPFLSIKTDYGDEFTLTNEIAVKLKKNCDYKTFELLLHTYDIIDIVQSKARANVYTFETNEVNPASILVRLYETGNFEYVVPLKILKIESDSNDPLYDEQFYLDNDGSNFGTVDADIDAPDSWTFTEGSGTKVAVLDDGVDLNHEDLITNLMSGYNAYASPISVGGGHHSGFGHGTTVAGVIAAEKDNQKGICGVAPQATIVPVNIKDPNGFSYSKTIGEAIDQLNIDGVDIINISWHMNYIENTHDYYIKDAIEYFVNSGRNGKGGVVICSSNNLGNNDVKFPASMDETICVGALINDNQWYPFSSYGPKLDVVAYGYEIVTTAKGSTYGSRDGTSFSTPMVSAICALIYSVNPTLTSTQVRNILEQTCDKIRPGDYVYSSSTDHPNGKWNEKVGYGKTNAYKAVLAAECSSPYIFTESNISDDKHLSGCLISIVNSSISTGGSLNIEYQNSVEIGIDFSMEEGAELEIKGM